MYSKTTIQTDVLPAGGDIAILTPSQTSDIMHGNANQPEMCMKTTLFATCDRPTYGKYVDWIVLPAKVHYREYNGIEDVEFAEVSNYLVEIVTSHLDWKQPFDAVETLAELGKIILPVQAALYLIAMAHNDNHIIQPKMCVAKTSTLQHYAARVQDALNQNWLELTSKETAYARNLIDLVVQRQDRPGYIYLLKSISGHYKIGRTSNPEDRLKTFEVKLPFEVAYEHVIPCDDMFGVEKALHSVFLKQRVNGEWFNFSPADTKRFLHLIHGGI